MSHPIVFKIATQIGLWSANVALAGYIATMIASLIY